MDFMHLTQVWGRGRSFFFKWATVAWRLLLLCVVDDP